MPRPAMLVAMVIGARDAGLRDDERFLLVVARVQDGEDLGFLDGAVVAGIKRGERRSGRRSRADSQPA